MMRILACLALLLPAFAPFPPAAQGIAQGVRPQFHEFRPLPLHEAARRVSQRYSGRLVAADTRPPHPQEHELGVMLVYEFRLVTPARQILRIRVDARDGRFLEVAGRGQIGALRGARKDGDD